MLISQVVGPRKSEVIEVPDPVAEPHQVVIEVLACGVCASDKRPWRELGTPDKPIRLGHESAGRIVSVGSEAGGWQVGDIVTGLGGDAFATRVALNADAILPVPLGMDPALALGEPIAVLAEALSRCGDILGKRVAIVGLGFMGLGLVQLVRRLAPALLVGVDPNPGARDQGMLNGTMETHDPEDLPEGLLDSMDLVLEVTGVAGGLAVSATLVRQFGTLCIVGYHPDGVPMLDNALWYKGTTVVNGFSPDRRRAMLAMADGLDLVAKRQFDYAKLITHRFGLDQVDEAYELMLKHPANFVKSVIQP